MFRGRFFHVMDDKGRITIPPRYREILQERTDRHLIVTNLDGYLIAFPQSEWEVIEQRLSQLSFLRKDFRAFQRLFVSGASECPLDRQGRILLPPSLREYAKLDKDVVLAGAVRCFEIWDRQLWDQEMTRIEAMDSDEVRKELGI
ncbi:division/cell wall cluster transcriptional repressor MraZ [Desulfobacca acetoxidans]|uniref:Transcriptional regulator MraZ n=1 Tax=Desulfobacca acetoxidans (strain ATCC 700848 / DSM 11109 / ASRB2) TaxID=880072 RepID=F2NG79_DESAR|nr:division/cell wall cluster transcriptional repressor MraZ [Desulfobacca acetoxidans]AEB08492.1 Protein mraZ [Desulfobacca acetoxidans DSM 11109]HAY21760.1 division/cell wall cluster transcriptional repressor MraZ [Desulfobacterales bacterium]